MSARERGSLAWDQLMRLGLGTLGLPPDVFWAMTPIELQRALEGAGILVPGGGAQWMERTALDALMARFPDKGSKE